MALVIEDGSFVSGANSFVTRAEVIAYASARGTTLPDEESTDIHAIRAMDYLWAQCLQGSPVRPTQSTPFPRKGLMPGDDAEGYTYEIPHGIRQAQLQLALDSAQGVTLTESAHPSPQLSSSKVGPIERSYFKVAATTLDGGPPLVVATAWLAPFVCADGFVLRTVRA